MSSVRQSGVAHGPGDVRADGVGGGRVTARPFLPFPALSPPCSGVWPLTLCPPPPLSVWDPVGWAEGPPDTHTCTPAGADNAGSPSRDGHRWGPGTPEKPSPGQGCVGATPEPRLQGLALAPKGPALHLRSPAPETRSWHPHLLDYSEADSGSHSDHNQCLSLSKEQKFCNNLDAVITPPNSIILIPQIFTHPAGDQGSPTVSKVPKRSAFTCSGRALFHSVVTA